MRSAKYLGLLLCCIAPAGAIPLPCGMDTMSNYLAPSFACTIGDKTFQSFAAGLTAITALGTAAPVSFSDITVLPGGDDLFTQANLFISDGSVSGLGAITAAEALCEHGSFTSLLNPLLCSGIGVNAGLTSNITNVNLDATSPLRLPR